MKNINFNHAVESSKPLFYTHNQQLSAVKILRKEHILSFRSSHNK